MPNLAPSGTNATVSIPRNYALRLSNFGFSDTDGNSLLAVRFTTLPTAGTLYSTPAVRSVAALAV